MTGPDRSLRLSLPALNRATLARQLLLRRHPGPALRAVRHLAGMQAQAPLAPHVGLWTRLADFSPGELDRLLTERSVVRAHLMRNTVHLVTAADFLAFRPLFQTMTERALAANFGRDLAGVDLAELREAAAVLLAERPLTRTQLAGQLAGPWPGHDPAALAYAATHLLHLVQVPPRGLWGDNVQGRAGTQATFALAAAWLGSAGKGSISLLAERTAAEQLVLRYLAAYGPASVRDIQAWSGLTRLREVTERMRAQLRRYTGPDGDDLLDLADDLRPGTGPGGAGLLGLPDEPIPDPGVPAPPRFLPEYDNLLLSFADRRRVIGHRRPVPLPPGAGARTGTLLVDGFWQANWAITRSGDRAVLEVRPFAPLGLAARDAVEAEGSRLLAFTAPAAARYVRFAAIP
jgi:Winged helix DNA-binding domain